MPAKYVLCKLNYASYGEERIWALDTMLLDLSGWAGLAPLVNAAFLTEVY